MQADDWWPQRHGGETSAEVDYEDGSGSGDDGRGRRRQGFWRVPIRDDDYDDYRSAFYYYYDYDASGSGDDQGMLSNWLAM